MMLWDLFNRPIFLNLRSQLRDFVSQKLYKGLGDLLERFGRQGTMVFSGASREQLQSGVGRRKKD